MKVKGLKIGIAMALTIVAIGALMAKGPSTQKNLDNTTLNIDQNESGTAYGSLTTDESLTEDEFATTDESTTEGESEITSDDEEYINFL